METDWDEGINARQLRDQRMLELQAQGMVCTSENLYNVQGQRVFILVASPPPRERISRGEGLFVREPGLVMGEAPIPSARTSPQRPVRSLPTYETR